MNPKANQSLIQSLTNRWEAIHNPSANTTCVASVAAVANARHRATNILASCRNQTAADVTTTLTIRDSSYAGTVLAQLDWLTYAADAVIIAAPVNISGLLGNAVFVEFGTPAASVTQKVALSGWTENPGN